MSYLRVKRGRAIVGRKADDIYDCNYMMFQNASYGNKWFYAFITGVEFLNNETSEVTFEIDVLQTWLFDFNLQECFIERETTATDRIGTFLEPEPVSLGEYVYNNYQVLQSFGDMGVIIAVVDTEIAQGTQYDRVYSGALLFAYNSSDVSGINSKIEEYAQQPEAIISIYTCPMSIIGSIPDSHALPYGKAGGTFDITLGAMTGGATLDGYTPRNKKLYTYPYNFITVDNANGSSLALRYEFFSGSARVIIHTTITQPVQAVLRPYNYKGSGEYTLNTEMLSISDFPLCSWSNDSFQTWIAQSSLPLILNTLGGIGTLGIASATSANPAITAGTTAIGIVSNIMNQYYQASIKADVCRGTVRNGNANIVGNKQMFWWGRTSISAPYARVIDEFFDMFGYCVRRVRKPNLTARPHWYYVKTVGCVVTGSVPADDIRHICEIFDSGITWWRNADEVGNYSLDNTVQ